MPMAVTHSTALRLALSLDWEKSNSSPIWNISMIRPIWLMLVMGGGICGLEQPMEGIRRQGSEQRRPQQQVGDDFPHCPRLGRQEARDTRHQEDDGDLQQGEEQQVFDTVDGGGVVFMDLRFPWN